ncbi:hypothetical protein OG905_00975 [Streptomyces sp. NBC_00322]|uniref:hypothetical protein n=1 Tax=Streptomyces sp. NBC_00322 TaxID=2975712 RepID=UPI002E2A7868|nr:hypothetical protein [Streptomyces sp. NBC_00322]
MTETSPQTDTTPDPPHPYTRTALARLLLSDANREVAESALGRIGTEDDSSSTVMPGDFVREAASLIRLAEYAQRQAVIYERERGTSWEEIGEALGITRQSAHAKFADYVKAWRAPLDEPERLHPDGTPDDRRIPYGARYAPGSAVPANGSAEKTACTLDRWLRQHSGPADKCADQEHPVSGGLSRLSTIEMALLVGDAAHRMQMDHLVPDPQAQADLWDLHADLSERLIRESQGGPLPKDIHLSVARDRARAKVLRATPGSGVTWDSVIEAGQRVEKDGVPAGGIGG